MANTVDPSYTICVLWLSVLPSRPYDQLLLTSLLPPPSGDDYAEVRDSDRQMLGRSLSPREVALEERIGEGQFGDVHKGLLYPGVSGAGLTSLL